MNFFNRRSAGAEHAVCLFYAAVRFRTEREDNHEFFQFT